MTTTSLVLSYNFVNRLRKGYNCNMKYCIDCNKGLSRWGKQLCSSCSKKGNRNPMYGNYGDKHPNYKGGYVHPTLGYKILSVGTNAKKYEHRQIMEEYLGRELTSDEIVHHINGHKTDNRIENLVVLSQSRHMKLHSTENRKQSCPHGHVLSEVGVYLYKNTRKCRQCARDRSKANYWRNKS